MALAVLVVAMTGCSSTQAINFKVHSEPEGAHVIYRESDQRWVYLGVTPLDVIEVVPDERLEGDSTISLKVMRCGYLDQEKEWTGEDLDREIDQKGQVFWTPRMIKNIE